MSDEREWRGLTLNQLIEQLTALRDEEGHGDLPVVLEDDRGAPTELRDVWLYWADDDEVETPVHWRVELA